MSKRRIAGVPGRLDPDNRVYKHVYERIRDTLRALVEEADPQHP